MFLRNYYNLMAQITLSLTKYMPTSSGFGNNSLVIRGYNGNLLPNLQGNTSAYNYIPIILDKYIQTSAYTEGGIIFGTGNEPVTFNDYQLGTMITSGLTSSKVSTDAIQYNEQENKFYSKCKYTLSNSKSEEIIIREYGIYIYNREMILLFRELIEPYALQPSESVNVILNVSYTMPTIDESGNVVAGSQAYGLAIE